MGDDSEKKGGGWCDREGHDAQDHMQFQQC